MQSKSKQISADDNLDNESNQNNKGVQDIDNNDSLTKNSKEKGFLKKKSILKDIKPEIQEK